MSRIGIFFGTDTGHTRRIAKLIAKRLGDQADPPLNINRVGIAELLAYDALILGTPTLGDGELPGLESGCQTESWLEFMPQLAGADLSGKRIALFGLGDQEKYPDAFCDAVALLYDAVTAQGAEVVGDWPTEGYTFATSQAVMDDRFVGLILDQDNQAAQSEARLASWLDQVIPMLSASLAVP